MRNLFKLIIIGFCSINCVQNSHLNKVVNESGDENVSMFIYHGIYESLDQGNTYSRKVIVTAYSEDGQISLSLCFIDVSDIAMKPSYKIIKKARVDDRGIILDGRKIIGSFKFNPAKDNGRKMLLVNDIIYYSL
jgi:hypothetical protein